MHPSHQPTNQPSIPGRYGAEDQQFLGRSLSALLMAHLIAFWRSMSVPTRRIGTEIRPSRISRSMRSPAVISSDSLASRCLFSTSISCPKKKATTNSHGKPLNQPNSTIKSSSGDPSGTEERFDRAQIEEEMSSTVDRLRKNINVIVNRVGRLTPAYLDAVKVVHHQQREGLNSFAQVIVVDPNTLSVAAYDPSYTKSIEKALYDSSLNLTPKLQSDGTFLISIPRLTVDVRQALAKESGHLCEQARSGLRNTRQTAQKSSRMDLDSNLITKDDFKQNQKTLDDVSKTYGKLIDSIEAKSKAVLLDK